MNRACKKPQSGGPNGRGIGVGRGGGVRRLGGSGGTWDEGIKKGRGIIKGIEDTEV